MKSALSAILLSTCLILPASGVMAQMQSDTQEVSSRLQKIDVKTGNGEEIQPGRTAVVHYTGWLHDPLAAKEHGHQFDSSRGRPPFSFVLGSGKVIKGWDQGVAGMKIGGKRTLIIPPELAYGARGAGGGIIPPNAALIFDIELIDIR